jgi:hypothetical protein
VAGLGGSRQGSRSRPAGSGIRSVFVSHHNGLPLTLVRGSLRPRHGGAVVVCTHPHLADWNGRPTRRARVGRHAKAWVQADPARLRGDPRTPWGCSNCFHGAAHEQATTADGLCRAPFGRLPTRQALPRTRPTLCTSWCHNRQALSRVVLAGRALDVPQAAVHSGR